MAVLQFWGFPACKTGDFHFAILGIFSLQETAFSVHDGAKKTGNMNWGAHLSTGTIKGREKELQLKGEYGISWNDYSNLDVKGGAFKYVLIPVSACSSESV